MFKGDLVQLVAMKKEYIDKGIKMMNEYEIRRNFLSGSIYPFTEYDKEKFFGNPSAFKENYCFAIETLDKEYIGHCGIHNLSMKNRVAYFGIAIADKDYLGKGYGSDAIKLLLEVMFNEMNLNKIGLEVFSFNERGIKCYEKLGFKREGALRHELFREGKYHDVIMMGLLREEWENDQI